MSSNFRKIKCEECGKQVEVRSKSAKFCSSVCRQANHKHRHTCYFCGCITPGEIGKVSFPEVGELSACDFCASIRTYFLDEDLTSYCYLLYNQYVRHYNLRATFCEWVMLPDVAVEDYRGYLLAKDAQHTRLMRAAAHIKLRALEHERAQANSPG